jgi:hypothetical protein
MKDQTEFVVMDCCPITGLPIGSIQKEDKRTNQKVYKRLRPNYHQEWYEKNKERLKAENHQKYLDRKNIQNK